MEKVSYEELEVGNIATLEDGTVFIKTERFEDGDKIYGGVNLYTGEFCCVLEITESTWVINGEDAAQAFNDRWIHDKSIIMLRKPNFHSLGSTMPQKTRWERRFVSRKGVFCGRYGG